jgi:hypothetical protein
MKYISPSQKLNYFSFDLSNEGQTLIIHNWDPKLQQEDMSLLRNLQQQLDTSAASVCWPWVSVITRLLAWQFICVCVHATCSLCLMLISLAVGNPRPLATHTGKIYPRQLSRLGTKQMQILRHPLRGTSAHTNAKHISQAYANNTLTNKGG